MDGCNVQLCDMGGCKVLGVIYSGFAHAWLVAWGVNNAYMIGTCRITVANATQRNATQLY